MLESSPISAFPSHETACLHFPHSALLGPHSRFDRERLARGGGAIRGDGDEGVEIARAVRGHGHNLARNLTSEKLLVSAE